MRVSASTGFSLLGAFVLGLLVNWVSGALNPVLNKQTGRLWEWRRERQTGRERQRAAWVAWIRSDKQHWIMTALQAERSRQWLLLMGLLWALFAFVFSEWTLVDATTGQLVTGVLPGLWRWLIRVPTFAFFGGAVIFGASAWRLEGYLDAAGTE